MNSLKLINTLRLILELLAQRRFDLLRELDLAPEWDAEYLAETLDYFGGTLTLPNDNRWDYDFFHLEREDNEHEVAIDYRLLIDGERSDLTLQCRMIDDRTDGYCSFTIEDLHVM